MTVTKYHSKLVGVTFEGRQDLIKELSGSEELRFRREPDNEYDKNAVAVDALIKGEVAYGEDWKPVGYIAKDKNTELAKILDDGKHAQVKIGDITGGDDKAYGVNIEIEYEKPYTSKGNRKLLKAFVGGEIYYEMISTNTRTRLVKCIYRVRFMPRVFRNPLILKELLE